MLHDVVSVVHNLVHSLLSGMTGVVVDLIHIIPGYVEVRVCIDHGGLAGSMGQQDLTILDR